MEQEQRHDENWFPDSFNENQNLSLLENALVMNNLYEHKKQKGNYTLKIVICKN